MKKQRITYILLGLLCTVWSCKQDVIKLVQPATVTPVTPSGSPGSADFSKFVAIGNSYVAGFQAGALFTDGQTNSLPEILFKQFQYVDGGTGTFNQPDINSVNGFNIQSSIPGVITLGRLVLYDPDGAGPRTPAPTPTGFPGSHVTCPDVLDTPPLPAPFNTADLPGPYTGDKSKLNNFGVPLIYLGQALKDSTGGPPTSNPFFNPFYGRFASQPGTSTILGDALGANGSFYLIWLGFDDVLLNAISGADGSYKMTDPGFFSIYYHTLITIFLGALPNAKGVVGDLPNITSLPYFYTIPWNAITLDASQVSQLAPLSAGYNAFLSGMVNAGIITEDEAAARRISFAVGNNPVLLTDEDLTDLSPFMSGPYASLIPYAKARQATATDLVPLSAGAILGTCYGGNPAALWGVSFPVSDTYMLTKAEIIDILTATAMFNASIESEVNASNNRLALAHVNKGYADFVTAQISILNGVAITPSFAPPTGAFSEDGLHPNSRGYAFTANIFIDAINQKFGATVPKASYADYAGTGLPVSPAQ